MRKLDYLSKKNIHIKKIIIVNYFFIFVFSLLYVYKYCEEFSFLWSNFKIRKGLSNNLLIIIIKRQGYKLHIKVTWKHQTNRILRVNFSYSLFFRNTTHIIRLR